MTVKENSKHAHMNATSRFYFSSDTSVDSLIVSLSNGDNAGDHTITQPTILSMEVVDDDSFESEYRLRIGNQVKYLVISPGPFDRDTLSFPFQSLPRLPYNEEWTVAHVSRDKTSGELKNSFLNRTLAGVKCQWHHTRIDCLELEKTKQLTAMAFEARLTLDPPNHSPITGHHDCQKSPFRLGGASHRTRNESIPVA